MSLHRVLGIAICGAGLSLLSGPAMAQQVPPWREGPGDVVLLRDVPPQNAILVGEPGRPTLVNPRSTVIENVIFSITPGLFTERLSDAEAETVRATRSPVADAVGGVTEVLGADGTDGAAFVGGQGLGADRSGFVGGTVSGAVGGATRQIQGVLSNALGRGRL